MIMRTAFIKIKRSKSIPQFNQPPLYLLYKSPSHSEHSSRRPFICQQRTPCDQPTMRFSTIASRASDSPTRIISKRTLMSDSPSLPWYQRPSRRIMLTIWGNGLSNNSRKSLNAWATTTSKQPERPKMGRPRVPKTWLSWLGTWWCPIKITRH